MWQEPQNETRHTLYYCRVRNFKQYLKAITTLYGENQNENWFESEYGMHNWSYEDWHLYFGTRYVNWDDELYDEEADLPDPFKFKCEEWELALVPDKYPAILVWDCDNGELAIFS